MGSETRHAPTRPTMKHNNQIHSARKKSRRDARHKKAAAIAPRPVAGCVRPLVHPPTVKYNSKTRIGRGFSVAEIKGAKLSKLEAKSLGISVDYPRRNKSVEGKQLNEQRLREYRANLVVFPRNAKAAKKGWKTDASAEETAVATQFVGKVVMKKGASESKVETMKITSEMKEANVARTLKAAWNDARLCGFREKRAAERAEKAAQEALKKSK